MKIYKCKICKKNTICYQTALYGLGMCKSCSLIGRFHTQKSKDKISKANKGKKRTKVVCNQMSKSHIGKKHPKETKEKMIKSAKKRWQDPKEREKLSLSRKGKKRKPFTKEWKENISKAKIGKKRPPRTKEHCENLSKANSGKKASKSACDKMSKAKKDKPLTKQHRENISKALKITLNKPEIKIKFSGKNNGNYINGLSSLPYTKEFTKSLKNEIKQRDKFTCQCCGMSQEEHLEKYNRSLEIHHIDYDKFNNDKINLITLCKECNITANYNRDYWFAYYSYINENKKDLIRRIQ
jgi:hypothetical protein